MDTEADTCGKALVPKLVHAGWDELLYATALNTNPTTCGKLATIDYAMSALDKDGARPTPAAILSYIEADDEWRLKIAKLRLTEASMQNVVVVLGRLFAAAGGSH